MTEVGPLERGLQQVLGIGDVARDEVGAAEQTARRRGNERGEVSIVCCPHSRLRYTSTEETYPGDRKVVNGRPATSSARRESWPLDRLIG